MKWIDTKLSLLLQADGRRMDIFLFGSGVLGSIGEFITDHLDLLGYWLWVAIPLAIARLAPVVQAWRDSEHNRKVKRLRDYADLVSKHPEMQEEIKAKLNIKDDTEG